MKKMMRRVWRPLLIALPLIPLVMLVTVTRAQTRIESAVILVQQQSEQQPDQYQIVRYLPDTQQYEPLVSNINDSELKVVAVNGSLYYIADHLLWQFDLATSQLHQIMAGNQLWQSYPESEWVWMGIGNDLTLLNTQDNSVFRPFQSLPRNIIARNRINFSPDKKSLAFEGCIGIQCEVYTVNLDGSGLINVTDDIEERIGFEGWVGSGVGWIILRLQNTLYKIRPDGQHLEKLIRNDPFGSNFNQLASNQATAPYQDWIMVSSVPLMDGFPPGWLAELSGSSIGVHLENAGLEWMTPQKRLVTRAPSPDGQWFTFIENSGLFQIHPDGTGLTQLATVPKDGLAPFAWSPDGQWLYLEEHIAWEQMNLYRIRADGTDLNLLTSVTGVYYFEDWSPDGEWLVFYFDDYYGELPILRVKADGSEQTTLFPNVLKARFVTWGDTYTYEVKLSSARLYRLAAATFALTMVAGFLGVYWPYKKAHRQQVPTELVN